eukprot:TRINITY_DN13505_c0_g1_i18.p2 TRINITY_DN13505_c0_g1~~TRINITY_DN13505_c0_g1_i18.p2  ORF type:complete len:117 (-),score=18.12 TRINITY_DN13505_c0_g1_i18:621-971(-)
MTHAPTKSSLLHSNTTLMPVQPLRWRCGGAALPSPKHVTDSIKVLPSQNTIAGAGVEGVHSGASGDDEDAHGEPPRRLDQSTELPQLQHVTDACAAVVRGVGATASPDTSLMVGTG